MSYMTLDMNPFKILRLSLFPTEVQIRSALAKKKLQLKSKGMVDDAMSNELAQAQAAHDFLINEKKLSALRDVILRKAEMGEKTDFAVEIARIERSCESPIPQMQTQTTLEQS